MKITSIKQQLKMHSRYSVYIDEKYSFSLGEVVLMDSRLHSGMELTEQEVDDYKKLSTDDKLYGRALNYVAVRQRTLWEVAFYLERKGADTPLAQSIVSKLSNLGLLDDAKFARSFINDRVLLRPSSRRKIIMELKKKRVPDAVINRAFAELIEESDDNPERTALLEVITRKRRQTKYQDDTKLMQYLARQGFGYSDIKSALSQDGFEDY